MKALVVGGTGPTGPHVLSGLLERGYEPVVFHRGVHEPPGLPDVRHIHGDPHFVETIREALGNEEFDVVLCMYGRLRHLATVLRSRCRQLVAVGGVPVYRNFLDPGRFRPHGMPVPAREDSPLAEAEEGAPQFSVLIREAERHLFRLASDGAYHASVLRYPTIYGPRSVIPTEWSVIKRIQDARPFMILADDGLGLHCRAAAANAAHALLCLVDHPETTDGEAYNVADDDQLTWRQWVGLIADRMQGWIEVASLPRSLAEPTLVELVGMPDVAAHTLLDTAKIRRDAGYQQVVPARAALQETVDHLLAHPVDRAAHPAYRDQFDYDAEDRLVSVYATALEDVVRSAARPIPDFMHPLPHPKEPGTGPDERGR